MKLRATNKSMHITLRRTVTRIMNAFLKSETIAYRKPWNNLQRKQKLKSDKYIYAVHGVAKSWTRLSMREQILLYRHRHMVKDGKICNM